MEDGFPYLIHTDHLGGTQVVTDQAGVPVELLDYHPYGQTRIDEQTGAFAADRAYIGNLREESTGLQYMNARYYHPARGQFVSQDPVFLDIGKDSTTEKTLLNPQALNSYSYGLGNPITNKDPDGREAWSINAGGAAEFGALVTPYGAASFNVGFSYVRNPDANESWIALPITFGANVGMFGSYASYPQADSAPLIVGAYGGTGASASYSPKAVKPEDLSGTQENLNLNAPLASYSQSVDSKMPNYNVGFGSKAWGSLSIYSTKTWTPSIKISTLTNAANSFVRGAAQGIQNRINQIQAQINSLRNQIRSIRKDR